MPPKPKKPAAKKVVPPAPVQKKIVKKAPKKVKKPPEPFRITKYLTECAESISKFFRFIFRGDFEPRKKELIDASLTFVHYN